MQAYEEQTRELRVAVKAAHREGEYQASMAMRSLQERMAVAMQRSDAATAQLAECASDRDALTNRRGPLHLRVAGGLLDWLTRLAQFAECSVCGIGAP